MCPFASRPTALLGTVALAFALWANHYNSQVHNQGEKVDRINAQLSLTILFKKNSVSRTPEERQSPVSGDEDSVSSQF